MRVHDETILGIDIGGTKIKTGYIDNGSMVELGHYPTPETPREFLDLIKKEIKTYKTKKPIRAVGIGCPGPVDQEAGIVLTPPNMNGWHHFPLTDELEKILDVPVLLENDGNAGALGEALYGSGEGLSNIFYIAIGTGLGAGIIIDSKIFHGSCGLASEIWSFSPDTFHGKKSEKNLNYYASGNGLVAQVKHAVDNGAVTSIDPDNITTYEIFRALDEGDSLADQVIERTRNALSGAVVNILTMLAPEMIVLGGGLCKECSWFVDPVIERVQSLIPIDELKRIPIKRSRLWDSAVLYGASSLFFPPKIHCYKP